MASISRDKGGTRRVQFIHPDDGKRCTIRLGRATVKQAERFAANVEALIGNRYGGDAPTGALAEWLANLPDPMHAKLAGFDLVQPRKPREAVTVKGLCDRVLKTAGVQESTLTAYRQTTASLVDYFGEDRRIDEIEPADADAWRQSLVDAKYATATISKRVQRAKTIGRRAVRWRLIASNPFDGLKGGSQSNAARTHYVGRDTIHAVIEACPNDEWRAVFALARYAGLRVPSEIVALTWGDIDWQASRLTVRSQKTNAVRFVPVNLTLRAILLVLFDQADEGETRVLPHIRCTSANLRTHGHRIIARAGVESWPRLFHNLRASCSMDWCERFPAHSVAAWLGHSPMIGARHYSTVRDTHFTEAAELAENAADESGAKCGALAVQNAAQHDTARKRIVGSLEAQAASGEGVMRDRAECSATVQKPKVAPAGFEPATCRL